MTLVWPKIVLFGDSQVQVTSFGNLILTLLGVTTSLNDCFSTRSLDPVLGKWGALLASRFQRVADVITRGFSGYTSRSGRIILPHIFFPENISDVEAFVIFFGTNDSSGKVDAPQYHVPVEQYSENIEEMIKYLTSIGLKKDKIILMTPGPYHEEKFLKWCSEIGRTFPSKDDKLVQDYVEACLNVAKKHDLDVINVYEEMKKDEDWPRFMIDGLHFSADGAALIYKLLRPVVEKKIDASIMKLPYWRDINSVKPEDNDEEICFKTCPNYPVQD